MSPERRAPRRTTTSAARKATPRPRQVDGAGSSGRAGSATALEDKLAAVRAIGAALAGSLGLDALFARIVPNVSRLMNAERTTLFLHDAETDEIWSKIAEGEIRREIRLTRGQGIAGNVASTRSPLVVPDAYKDPRFDSSFDALTGFRTRTIIAVPVLGRQGELLGVLQVLNHDDGPFGDGDLGLLETIAAQLAYAVENARLAQQLLDQNRELDAARTRAERRRAELDLLYQLEQETSAAVDLDALLDSAIVRTCARLRSDAGSVLLADRQSGKLFFRGVSGPRPDELRRLVLEPGQGIVGWAAQHGQPALVNDPSHDERHARSVASSLQYPVRAALAVPLVWDQKVIGAVEVLNPTPRSTGAVGYDDEDLKLLTVVAGQLARAVSLALERQARLDTERLAVIGRMLAGVAHDLRNPMTVISGFAQLMVGSAGEPERQAQCDRVLREVDEMTGMIADLLAFARGDSRLRPVMVSLRALADDVRENLSPQCKARGTALAVQAPEGAAQVDLGRVKRIVYNLARNAIEALNRGGNIAIELGLEGPLLTISVKDDGPGLPAAMAQRLFEPFATAGKANGTGLGLAIVKRFVDDHGGTVTVESESGKGTSFFVRLPFSPSPSP
jgi:signal transduction histidine kinase